MFAGPHVWVGHEPAAQSGADVDRRGGPRRTEAQDVATLELRRRAVRRRRHERGHEEELEQVGGGAALGCVNHTAASTVGKLRLKCRNS